jgi:hypothetical protein
MLYKLSWNFNANLLLLIPKTDTADSVEHYRPIALANFKFKIISKNFMADRLATIMPNIIFKEQRGFIPAVDTLVSTKKKRLYSWKTHQGLHMFDLKSY